VHLDFSIAYHVCDFCINNGSTFMCVVSGRKHYHPDFLGDIAICTSSLYYLRIEYDDALTMLFYIVVPIM
jgi:hypothetical protein